MEETPKSTLTLDSINDLRRLPLDRITIDQARRIARRIVHEEADVPKVGVAAFGSYL